jgi:hypothetical protein
LYKRRQTPTVADDPLKRLAAPVYRAPGVAGIRGDAASTHVVAVAVICSDPVESVEGVWAGERVALVPVQPPVVPSKVAAVPVRTFL